MKIRLFSPFPLLLLIAVSCSSSPASELIRKASEFRELLSEERYEEAQRMMSEDARRWWEEREGEGSPWRVDGIGGPWAKWDRHFETRRELVRWTESGSRVTLLIRETNDYFLMLDRGWVTNEITYYFDEAGKINGLLIRGVGERPPGRTDEFLAWAREHEPDEIAELMPGGEIDPSGDHPERFRRLLEAWRREAGLSPVD